MALKIHNETVLVVTTCCGAFRESLYKMLRNTYATGDLRQPKSPDAYVTVNFDLR
jgi:hypothetical protein